MIEYIYTQLDKLDTYITKSNIRTILITTVILLFATLFLIKTWDAKIMYNTEVVQENIESNIFITEEFLKTSEGKNPKEISENLLNSKTITEETVEQPTKSKVKSKIPKITAKQLAFIDELKDVMKIESNKFGIPISIKIAQSAIESGWGEDPIVTSHNNWYGMKYKKAFDNSEVVFINGKLKHNTSEFVGNVKKFVVDEFALYETKWMSIRHHSVFLKDRIDKKYNKGYTKMSKLSRTDYKGWANALGESGYSTNKKYAEHLIRIIEEYQLYKLDK